MTVIICLLVLSFAITTTNGQTPDSVAIHYVVDTIAAPNCYLSEDGAILLDSVSVPGTIDRYEWSNGSVNEDLIYVNGGFYQLTIYNTDGASFKSENFYIPETDTLVLKPFVSPPTSSDKDNGFIDLTISGGTGPFELTMIFNQDTTTITTDSTFFLPQVDTGFYYFSVLDAHGCTDTTQRVVVAESCGLLATALVDPAECQESSTGRIELLIENAVEPYTIDWATRPDNRPILRNLPAGLYPFVISDRRKCTIIDTIEVKINDQIPPEALVNDEIILYLNGNGEAHILPQQIVIAASDECHNNLTYMFDKSTFTCLDVGKNDIIFSIIDGVGNATLKEVEVEIRDTQTLKLIYQDTVYTSLCNGIAQYEAPRVQGSCSTTSTGGIVKADEREITAPGTYLDRYYYVRKPGDTLWAEMTVIVSNTRVRSFLIVEQPKCNTGSDGSIAVALRNSKIPVSYLWDDGSDKDYIFGIRNKQEYRVTVTEGNGCVFELSAFIEGPDSLSVKLKDIIQNEETVDIIPQVTGGNEPLQYTWYSEGKVISQSKNLLNVPDGKQYQLLVTDALGCISDPLIVDRIMTSSRHELEDQIAIFPNPASGYFMTIRIKDQLGSFSKIRLINSHQQIIKEIKYLQDEIHVSIGSFPSGLYFAQFYGKEGYMFTKKFILF